MSFGGSLIRPEATGYGLIYFVEVRTPELCRDRQRGSMFACKHIQCSCRVIDDMGKTHPLPEVAHMCNTDALSSPVDARKC